jgi:c-di-GMP-binding flagellar brake protein YcgR
MPDERAGRRAPRVAARCEGVLLGREERPVRLVDLSVGGCLVSGEARLAPGALHDLRLQLEDGPLNAQVRVADCSVDGSSLDRDQTLYLSGLQFVALPPSDERRLLRLVESLRRSGSGGA